MTILNLFNEARAMAQRAIVEAVGIPEQFKVTWVLIDNHRAGFHSERMESNAFRTNFAV